MGVGKQLRQAREARGLTVRDVADLTKISSRQIEAIEAEHYEKLPGGIFGRGYVRAVAVALKLDADAFVRAYRDETEADHLGTADAAPSPGHPSSGVRPPAAAAPWRFETKSPRMRLAPAEPAGPDATVRVIAAVLIGIGVILAIIWLGRDRSASPLSHTPAPSQAPVASAQPRSGPQPVGTTGRVASHPSADQGPSGTEVRVQAARPCWVVLTIDGERVAHRMLKAGDVVRATMRESGTLHTGDAGAVSVALGGGADHPVGPPGAVRTIDLAPPAR